MSRIYTKSTITIMAAQNKFLNIMKSFCYFFNPSSLSLQVKFICTTIILTYCLSFHERTLVSLAVLPGDILPPNFWIWTFFTHNLLEIHWWLALFDLIVMTLYGRILHPVWGTKEMLMFYIVVNLAVAVLTVITYFGFYTVLKNPDYIFDVYIHGLSGYIAGFSVALKQIMPEQVMIGSTTSYWKCYCRNSPMLFFSVVIFLWLLNCVGQTYVIMFFWGLVVSWIYLRFYQRHPRGVHGDSTDNFSFASFFPKPLQPLASVCSTVMLTVCMMLRICSNHRHIDEDASTTITVKLHGVDHANETSDTERWRLPVTKGDCDQMKLETFDWSTVSNYQEVKESRNVDGDEEKDLDSQFVVVDLRSVKE